MATSLTEEKNLKMPEIFGGNLGMDRGRLEQAAINEAMRLGGGEVTAQSAARTVQTPYGVTSTNVPSMTQSAFQSSTGGVQGAARPERYTIDTTGEFQRQFSGAEDQALALGRASEAGANIAANIQQQNTNRYYAFRQGLEERRAAEALTPSFGGDIGRDRTMRGAQALVQAERFRQAQEGRSPMSREPISAMGMEFRNIGMGQVAPIFGSQQSLPWQSVVAQGFMNQGVPQSPSATSFGGTSQSPVQSMTPKSLYSSVGRPAISSELASTQFGERLQQEPFSGLMTAMGGPQPRRRSRQLPALAGRTSYLPFRLRA